jgi:ribose transport system ATP-binding protein
VLLQLRGVSKRYDGTQALRDVDLSVEGGEVHAIVGENGAGKSTLVKILTGAVRADAGEIRLDERPMHIDSPLAAQRLGIRVVHQHASLVPHLTVTENILLGGLPTGRLPWWIDWREARLRAERTLNRIGMSGVPVRERVARLGLAHRKLVEIAKALAVRPRLLIMDEPSAVLAH